MKELFGILILLLSAISFTSCDKDDINELIPEALIKRGTGHCEAWTVKE